VNPLRPLSFALTAVALLGWSAPSPACDQDQARGASATTASATAKSNAACTAQMAKTCTAAAAAHCPMKGASAAAATAKTSSMDACCAGHGAAATTAVKSGPSNQAIDAEFAGACAAHGAKATAVMASAGGACPHGAKSAAMANGACADHAKTTAATAGAGSCAAHGARNAVMAEAAPSCGGRGMLRTSGTAVHPDCEACLGMQACEATLRKLGASMQVVSLKNGVMYIYTADRAHLRGVQQELVHRRDQMAIFASAGSSHHLCPDCRQMRGAAMSGKLTTEVVSADDRCISLMTSSDPTIVSRIHALAGLSPAARAKL
jgi:hypothetical protein